jgi:hypothetical protein
VHYPAGWLAARRVIDADRAPGSVLILPWAAYRRYRWNGGRTVLDPWPRLVRRPAIWNDGASVGNLQLTPEDPEARRLSPLIRSGAPLTAALRADGVRYVIIDSTGGAAGQGGAAVDVPGLQARLGGAQRVAGGSGLAVYRVPAATAGTGAARAAS